MVHPFHFRFCWRDSFIILRTEEAGVARVVGHLLALPPLTLSVTDGPPDLEVRRIGNDGWVLESAVVTYRFEFWNDLLLNVIALMGGRFLQKTGHLVLHAGACVVDGQAILFTGPSRVGKSSLALAAWLAGREVIVDDWLAVDSDCHRAFVFPKALKPRVAGRAVPAHLVGRLSVDHCLVGQINDEYRLIIGRGLPQMADYTQDYSIARLYMLDRAIGPTSHVEKVDRQTALQGILAQTMITARRTPLDMVRILRFLLERGEVYRLHVGEHDLERAVDIMFPQRNRRDQEG
ncbi:conserved hypothetical protein [Gammaproteobacteria bacterium]